MQTVAAAAGAGIVERVAKVVAAEKPLERAPRFGHPSQVAGGVNASMHAEIVTCASMGC